MSAREKGLDRLRIASPCASPWEAMRGDGRRRFCAECERHVYDFAQLTAREAAGLVEATGGALCALLTRDGAGRLVTLPPPEPLASPPAIPLAIRRSTPLAAAAVAALLGLAGAASAGSAREAPPAAASRPALEPGEGKAPAETPPRRAGEAGGSLAGTLASDGGAPIPDAEVEVRGELDGRQRTARTDEQGNFSFTALPAGIYSLAASARGYHLAREENVLLRAGETGRVALTAPDSTWRQAVSGAPAGIAMGGAIALVEDPLRRLYDGAGMVALGTAGKSTVVKQGEYTWEMRTDLAVSSVVKGETNERVIAVFHDQMPGEEPDGRWRQGNRVLVFLDPREAEDGRGLAGYTVHTPWGFRELAETELAAYGRRLAALGRAERRGAARPEDLAEWLVATAEEPATRGDAVRELGPALAELERQAEQHGTPVERYAADLRAVLADFLDAGGRPAGDADPAVLGAFLTAAHRERLTAALLGTARVTHPDLDLYEVVERWHDGRVEAWLVDRVKAGEVMGWALRRALSLLAKESDDEDLADLVAAGEETIDALERELQTAADDAARERVAGQITAAEDELRQRFLTATFL